MTKQVSHTLVKYFEKYGTDTEKMKDFSEFIEKLICGMESEYDDIKEYFISEIHEFTYEIDEEVVTKVISKLKHKDDTESGCKWSSDETVNVIKQYGVKEKIESFGCKFNPVTFYFAMNYVYAVHHSVNRTLNGYIDLAVDELLNKNVSFKNLICEILENVE